jgi:transposase
LRTDWKTLPRDEFNDLVNKHPAKKIAEMFGVTFGAVYYRIRTYGMPLRGHKDPRAPSSRKFQPPKKELAGLLKRMSMKKIAEHYGVGETVVFMRCKQYGLEGPSRSERLSVYAKNRPASHNQKIGETLSTRTGPLAANWRGGVTEERKLARGTQKYMKWKLAVITRDGFKCVRCGVEQGHVCECCGSRILLHAHHLKSFSEFPDLRYDVDNGIALCGICHWKEHNGKQGELLETPKSPRRHNVAGNGKRDGQKSRGIGQSAAKPTRNGRKVQRLGKVGQNG